MRSSGSKADAAAAADWSMQDDLRGKGPVPSHDTNLIRCEVCPSNEMRKILPLTSQHNCRVSPSKRPSEQTLRLDICFLGFNACGADLEGRYMWMLLDLNSGQQ